MKYLITCILFILSSLLFAQQNNLVEYNLTTKQGAKHIIKEYLIFNSNELYYASIKNDDKLNYEDDKLSKEVFNLEPIYINLETDSLYQEK